MNIQDDLKPDTKYKEPETDRDRHRPAGSPHSREIKSQKQQLNSGHRHGTDKDIKIDMHAKTGLKDGLTKRNR
ncbi:hypothetical protein Dtox_2368 [Desulfofarcimen acetoxidans DSM 771]|jgi:hypothetical protein|uniref:Uncharacterized protein n=1 Tax=Desulfofarcimen acetoxidans (strain ATCC 49208 / DSM 771 / KCTC 5769 / VKM B-1644 / 5575) TaxID=485916 RepID=C8W0C4_DESAS|nr:hypothetical protein [Desulfofarcimen acetoxidans]ACV63179.1 hypothetical protein Dtox_2368 [Desulfofarcimen acetoxidans DSM 771]